MPESISMEDLSVLYDNIMGDKGPEYRSIDEDERLRSREPLGKSFL